MVSQPRRLPRHQRCEEGRRVVVSKTTTRGRKKRYGEQERRPVRPKEILKRSTARDLGTWPVMAIVQYALNLGRLFCPPHHQTPGRRPGWSVTRRRQTPPRVRG